MRYTSIQVYIKLLLQNGKFIYTIPKKPQSRLQKYVHKTFDRAKEFLGLSVIIFHFTEDSDLAGYISDDFGLISDAKVLKYTDLWLDKLVACYEIGIIPSGAL